ncbi:MAG: hypothetical protein GF330_11135 [Candidatus Eisenbacteria bacterium]|nr:hypothetical protein [Candidatus Eisenbacteria bacterium]
MRVPFPIGGLLLLLAGPTVATATPEADARAVWPPERPAPRAEVRHSEEYWACCHPYTWECFLLTAAECARIDGLWFPECGCEPSP